MIGNDGNKEMSIPVFINGISLSEEARHMLEHNFGGIKG